MDLVGPEILRWERAVGAKVGHHGLRLLLVLLDRMNLEAGIHEALNVPSGAGAKNHYVGPEIREVHGRLCDMDQRHQATGGEVDGRLRHEVHWDMGKGGWHSLGASLLRQ